MIFRSLIAFLGIAQLYEIFKHVLASIPAYPGPPPMISCPAQAVFEKSEGNRYGSDVSHTAWAAHS